jgi:hypothetical protein
MVYLARIEPLEVDAVGRPAMSLPAIARPSFSSLEWSIIRLARGQDLSTIREPGLLRRFYYWLIGRRGNRGLANERLEALRRMAVLSWHFGFSVAGEDVAGFLSAGFTREEYELLVASTRTAPQLRTIGGEVLA